MAFYGSECIFSSSALATRQREVKDAATKGIVHITENGNGAFVFCSEELFAQKMDQVREETLYEVEMMRGLQRARADFDQGRFYDDLDEFRRTAVTERASRG